MAMRSSAAPNAGAAPGRCGHKGGLPIGPAGRALQPAPSPAHRSLQLAGGSLSRSAGRASAAAVDSGVQTAPDAKGASSSGSGVNGATGMPVHPELGPPPGPSRLVKGDTAYEEEHRIRGSEAGPDQKATILTVANLMQEAGSNHAVSLYGRTESGFAAAPEMLEAGLLFAATRIHIQIDEYPGWADNVRTETWFQANGRICLERDWELTNATTGKTFGRATSMWVMINMNTRRLSKIPAVMRDVIERFSPAEKRISVDRTEAGLKIPELSEPFEIAGPVQVARRADMDMNGHINNVTYLAWALETVPDDVFAKGHLYQMEIDYKSECKAGDTVESLAQRLPASELTFSNGGRPVVQYVHTLRRCDDSGCTELVRARTTWLLPKEEVSPPAAKEAAKAAAEPAAAGKATTAAGEGAPAAAAPAAKEDAE